MADKIDRINFEQPKAGPEGVEYRSTKLRLTKSSGTILNINGFIVDGPKGKIHAYMDIGGRAMQEQLPRTYFVT